MDNRHNEILTAIEARAHQVVPKDAVVLLFGSQARGAVHDGSDWDLLILLNKPRVELKDYDEVAFPLRQLGWELGEMVNPILYSFADWEKQSITPFYHNVIRDSVRLCD